MTQILGVALVLALVAGLPVTSLVTAVAVADIVTCSVRAIPRQVWPVLNWRRSFA